MELKIIVSLTSWPPRINNVVQVLTTILQQTIVPDKIELNLSIEEFPNKEYDLPKDLNIFIQEHNIVEINWVEKNTGVFKKFIPTLQKHQNEEEYILFTIDDDRLYDSKYIEIMLSELGNNDAFCLAAGDYIMGSKVVYKSSCFTSSYWKCLTEKIIKNGISDYYTRRYLKYRNKCFKHSKNLNLKIIEFNPICPNSKTNKDAVYDKQRVKIANAEINKIIFKE